MISHSYHSIPACITGRGILCSIGRNIPDFKQALQKGQDGISKVNKFDVSPFSAKYGAMLPNNLWAELVQENPHLDGRILMAKQACLEALQDIEPDSDTALILGICLGTMAVDFKKPFHSLQNEPDSFYQLNKLQKQAKILAESLPIKGLVLAPSSACASSNHAIGVALDLLRFGQYKRVLVAGTGEVTREMFAGFYALGNMSDGLCAPFSLPMGLNLGEGAGALLLEHPDICQTKKKYGYILGTGSSADAYHPTSPHPGGKGVSLAAQRSMQNAHIKPEDIDFISAHGTGTSANDKGEVQGLKKALMQSQLNTSLASSKSFLGHTGAGAGLCELLAVSVLSDSEQIPFNFHYDKPRRFGPKNPALGPYPPKKHWKYSLIGNSGFGGANASTVMANADYPIRDFELETVSAQKLKPIYICGMGYSSLKAGEKGVTEGDKVYLEGRDKRFLDPITSMMLVAAGKGLEKVFGNSFGNGLEKPFEEHIQADETWGGFSGVSQMPAASVEEFHQSITERGLAGLSPHAFSRLVMNASLGAVCERFEMRGPNIPLAAAENAGLFALALAYFQFQKVEDMAGAIVLGADESSLISHKIHESLNRPLPSAQQAVSMILSRQSELPMDSQPFKLSIEGVGLAGSKELQKACSMALAGMLANDVLGKGPENKSPKNLHLISCLIGNAEDDLILEQIEQLKRNDVFSQAFSNICTDDIIQDKSGYGEASSCLSILKQAIENKAHEGDCFLALGVHENNGSVAIFLKTN